MMPSTMSLSFSLQRFYEILILPISRIYTKEENEIAISTSSKPILVRQMTTLGRFAFRSQTIQNPSIITFFVALTHEAGKELDLKEFQSIWEERVIDKHERFRCQISPEDDRYFEVNNEIPLDNQIVETPHPHGELAKTLESKILSPMDATKGLWDISFSCGELGSSGAIPEDIGNEERQKCDKETVALIRIHHSLCDGVSIAVAIGDLSDEAGYLRERIHEEIKRRQKTEPPQAYYYFVVSVISSFFFMFKFVLACFYALVLQLWKMFNSRNPFETVLSLSEIPANSRSIHWENVTTLEEMKAVAKRVSSKTTINDVACAMVTHAIKKQLEEHSRSMDDRVKIRIPNQVNITIPVHLSGGILRPGDQLGNNIGGFVSTIPLDTSNEQSSISRLQQISKILQREKALPSPLISWQLARMFTRGPLKFCTFVLKKFSANSVAVVSNVKGFPIPVHWLGRRVQFLCAFLPLPPGIPIGVVISSYAGMVSFGLNADKRAIPDARKFSNWMLDEFERIKDGF